MKLITKFKSKNFDSRRSNKIIHIIIHYTALDSLNEAIEFLCEPSNKVSCHYLISSKGEIYNLVNDKKRAWHAGISYWRGNSDINSTSIGIELDFNPRKNKKYSKRSIGALKELIKKLKQKYKIKNENILGHSDISPFRKQDPGQHFPWYKLTETDLIHTSLSISIKDEKVIENWFKKINIYSEKHKILFMLAYIGYQTEPCLYNNYNYKKLLKVYISHYGKKISQTQSNRSKYNIIKLHFLNQVLTS